MTGATVGTMLDAAQEFGIVLERFLAGVRDSATSDNTRLLTYYLARLKRNLPNTHKLFTDTQLAQMRAIPLKTINAHFVAERCFDNRFLAPEVKPAELLETAIELVDILLSFYQWLLDQPLSNEAHGLLELLVKTEERGLSDLKKIKETQRF
ncbi:MAG: hypothetical protein PHC61_02185 [Chitinivibrionales bacterium]|nr:hypothetical protein [Chitinivibrionales bacterium]